MSSGSSNIDPLEMDALPDEFNIEDDRSTGRQRRRRGRGRPRIGPQFVRPQINVVRRNAQQIYGHRRMGARQRTSAQQTESTLRPPQAVVQGRQVSVLLRLVTQHPGQQETGTILRLTIDLPDQSGNTSPEHMQNMSPETNTTEADQPQTQAQHRLQLLQQALPRGRPVRMQVPWSMTVPISLPQRPTLPESQYQMETQLQMGSQSQVESQLAEPQAQPAQMLSTQLPAQSQSEPQSQLEEQTPPAPEYRPEAQSQPLESLSQPEQQPVIRVEPQPQEESPVLSGPQPQAFIQPTPPQLSPDVQILFLPMMGVEPHVQSHLLGELRFRPGQASQPHHHRRSHRRHRRQMEHETGLRDQPHFYIDSSEQPQSEAPQQHFDPNNPHSPPSI